jgi:hypothetical protein
MRGTKIKEIYIVLTSLLTCWFVFPLNIRELCESLSCSSSSVPYHFSHETFFIVCFYLWVFMAEKHERNFKKGKF